MALHSSFSIIRYFLPNPGRFLPASIQDFDTIVSSEILLEMEALNVCKDSLISMEIETFDRLRPGLNSFHGELFLIGSPHKGSEHM